MICGLLYLGVSICFIVWSVIIDAEHIAKKQYIENHQSRWILRCLFYMAIGISHIWYGIAAALLFTALFDQLLNQARGKSFWYLGTVAKWDIFFSNRKWLYITVKLLALITAVAIFLLPMIIKVYNVLFLT